MCVLRLCLSQWCSALIQCGYWFPLQTNSAQIKSLASPRNESDACMFLKCHAAEKKAVKRTFCLYLLVSQCVKRASKPAEMAVRCMTATVEDLRTCCILHLYKTLNLAQQLHQRDRKAETSWNKLNRIEPNWISKEVILFRALRT